MIRKASPADIPAIVALGLEALEKHPHPGLIISRAKIKALALRAVSSAEHFAWVAEKDGAVGGAVTAIVSESPIYEKKQCTVVQFYSRIPGEGIKLLREFMRWARERSAIKMVIFSLEANADLRIAPMLTRLGMRSQHSVLVATR